jgi:predicted Zn finger-like uncharacterized protein
MIVICEECGKKYRVDPSRIKGRAASFKCHTCRHVIVAFKPRQISSENSHMPPRDALRKATSDERLAIDEKKETGGAPTADRGISRARHRQRPKGLGLTTKMLLLFLFIPIILMAGACLFYLWQFEILSRLLTQESTAIFTRLAEKDILVALVIFGKTLLLIAIIIIVYARRLTGKIRALTEVAERISGGELEAAVETKSRDELGELSEAIAGMRDYMRLSVDRLRRR